MILVVLALLAGACTDGAGGDPTSTTLAVSTQANDPTTTVTTAVGNGTSRGCAVLHKPGEYEGVGQYGDVEQPYSMVVPATYAEIAPVPLYIHLASGGGDHSSFLAGWRPGLGDLDGLMMMVNTVRSMSVTPDALASLVDQVSSEYCVDARRVHVLGTATSFDDAENFACAYPDRVASFIAAFGDTVGTCVPDHPVPLLTFTGDPDRPGVDRLVDKWVEINGCDPEPLVEDLGSGVRRKAYQDCAADILFYDIEGMGHTWPVHEARGLESVWVAAYDEVDYLEEAYAFFADHPLP